MGTVHHFKATDWVKGFVRCKGGGFPAASKDVALIIGTSARMTDDLAAFDALGIDAEVFAVNNAARLLDRDVHHFVAIDFPKMAFCAECLTAKVHTIDDPGREAADFRWHFENRVLRMSGIFAATIAIAMGFRKVLLAGAGMDASGQTDGTVLSDLDTESYPIRWQCTWAQLFIDNCKDYVRSFSGLTMKSFGAPTKDFVRS